MGGPLHGAGELVAGAGAVPAEPAEPLPPAVRACRHAEAWLRRTLAAPRAPCRLAKDKAEVVAKVDAQCSALAAELEAFNAKFEEERADRQKREAALIAAQSELEQRLTEQIDQERAARERQVMQLRTELDAEIARRTKADERFQTAMAEELAAVRNVRALDPLRGASFRCMAYSAPECIAADAAAAVAILITPLHLTPANHRACALKWLPELRKMKSCCMPSQRMPRSCKHRYRLSMPATQSCVGCEHCPAGPAQCAAALYMRLMSRARAAQGTAQC